MDRYTQFGLRGDADEQIRRAVRDGFKRAGLGSAQLTEALEVVSCARIAASAPGCHRRCDRGGSPAPPVAQPAVAPSPPAAPAPVKVVVSDADRIMEIEAMMRVNGGKGYWGDPGVQREYGEVLARPAGEAAPLSPQAQPAATAETSNAAEAPPAPADLD
jgi:hypothetical protein